nr:hypothetical protein [Escherichia coli]
MPRTFHWGKKLKVGFLEEQLTLTVRQWLILPQFRSLVEERSYPPVSRRSTFAITKKRGETGHRFVKAGKGNFVQDVVIPEHTVTIPPRPFFRKMIEHKSPEWGEKMATLLRANDFDTATALVCMGEHIKGQLQMSVRDWESPPNAASTARQKGFNNPLIETGHMMDSVDYSVDGGKK